MHYLKYLLTKFMIIVAFLINTAPSNAHECGPANLSLTAGTQSTWQITADLREVESVYTPLSLGDPNIIKINPDKEFTAHDGVFTITALNFGTTTFSIKWFYEPTSAEGVCTCSVNVKSAPTSGVKDIAMNDDSYVTPYNNVSSHGDKFIPVKGGVFMDASYCKVCLPPDKASLFASNGQKNDTPDPITLHNGEFILQMTDLRIPGRGFDWTFTRIYKSRITYDGPLGHNWDFNYNSRLVVITDDNQNDIPIDTFTPVFSESFIKLGSVIIMDGHGRSDLYGLQPDGTYSTPLGAYTRLTKKEDGSFILRDRTGNKKYYSNTGFLIKIEDRHKNTMIFTRNSNGRLTEAMDTLGRKISYVYNNEGRLVAVNDFINRSIKFEYDSNGDLVSVTSPSVTGTPNNNDFPDGKTTKYTYSSGFQDEKLNHNLLTITAPNEVAKGGTPSTINVYETIPNSYAYGRVIKQTYGGTNASGIKAGGDIMYQYEELTQNLLTTNDPINRVTVIDRNGNKTIYEHNRLGNAVSIKEYTRGLREGEPEFYATSFEYNADGERTKSTLPEGNKVNNAYASETPGSVDYMKSRFKHGNLLKNKQIPDSDRGGNQQQVDPTYTYEPIYNLVRTQTDPRGNDPDYVPQNGGIRSAERYTTTSFFDYQEGNNLDALADVMGISSSEVQSMLNKNGVTLGLGDLNGDGITNNISGDIVKVVYPTVSLLNGSHQAKREGDASQEMIELFIYNVYGQILSRTDPEGNVTEYDYYPENDPDGDGMDIIEDKGEGHFGYLKKVVVDTTSSPKRDSGRNPTPVKTETGYFYDPVGNIIKETNGRGIAAEYIVNELNQVVQIILAASIPSSLQNSPLKAYKYLSNIYYDHNNNILRKEIENRDSNNTSLAGTFIKHTYVYDILNNLVKQKQDATKTETLVTEYRYDANENRIKTIQPEGNIQKTMYDERDLVFRTTNVCGCSGGSPNVTYNYDKNGNLIEMIDGADNNDDGKNDSTFYEYDGFNRLIRITDPIGNITEREYDPVSNVIKVSRFGVIGGPSPKDNAGTGNVLLSSAEYFVDELSRRFQKDELLFISSGVNTVRIPVLKDGPLAMPHDGRVTSRYEYDRKGRMTFFLEDDGDIFEFQYDGADRRIIEIDPERNSINYTYDGNNNIVKIVEKEITQKGDNPSLKEQFATIFAYDSLDRLVRITDNIGQTMRLQYDSRNNLTFTSDAQGKLGKDSDGLFDGLINKNGNTMHFFYDGINRKIRVVSDLRVGGAGDGMIDTTNPFNPDGKITISYIYDKNSRLASISDDKGNTTHYGYDDSNRVIEQINADGTTKTYEYDQDNNLIKATDENGSVIKTKYDAHNRLIQKTIIRAKGVAGTTQQKFEYDGLSRLTKSFDNNTPGNKPDDVTVTHAYDSLGRVIEEIQNGKAISSQWDGDDNRLMLIYPNGRMIKTAYDKLDRIDKIKSVGSTKNIADYDYIGPARILERTYNNGTRLTFLDDNRTKNIGYDKNRRPVTMRYLTTGNALVAGFKYNYDRADNIISETRLHEFMGNMNVGDVYEYDSAYRLFTFRRNVIGSHMESGNSKSTKPDEKKTEYTLDGLGNWAKLTMGDKSFNNKINEMNEYVRFKGKSQIYSHSGNLIDDGTYLYEYDFANRLQKVIRKTDHAVIATYTYDAQNRRIERAVTNTTNFDDHVRYLYDGWREIEEQRDNSTQQYVYGMWIDEPLTLDRDNDGDGGIDETFFYHNDGKANTIALTDMNSDIIERYTYDAYGQQNIFLPMSSTSDLNIDISSGIGNVNNPYLFTGRRLDPEINTYYFRNRYYNSRSGRFLQRDLTSFGTRNLYEYAQSNPIRFVDPLGLQATFPGLTVSFDSSCSDGVAIDLTAAQQNAVAKNISDACTTFQNALRNLARIPSYQPNLGHEKTKKKQLTADNNLNRLNDILTTALKEGCGSLTVECECACNPGVHAYTRGDVWGSWANLHLCPLFSSTSADEQAKTILHELTHYGDSEDDTNDDLNAHNLERLLPWLENVAPPPSPSSNSTALSSIAPVSGQSQTGK